MTLHSKPDPTMITNHFCACGLFSKWNIQQNYFVFVEFWTTFFRVLTCFNGSAAAMDAQLGFGTRLRWFCDRGVWWKRTFCGKFGSGNDVDWVLLLLELGLPMSTVIRVTLTALLLRCHWQQRFFDIQTSANLRKFVLSFVSSISLKTVCL